jgi:gliding motility-associated-like protein
MNKKYLLAFAFIFIFLLCLLPSTSQATHIVGGELEMTHVSGNNYRFRLILYFDAVNGNPSALDQNVNVHTFAKTGNRFVRSYLLPLTSNTLVNYTNPACAVGSLVTRRIVYERTFTLNPNEYADQGGYYAVWERCCRNGVIDNIINPGGAGQAFYMEFPPLLRGGQRFLNSSPQLFPPLSDYACVNQPFFFNFSGTDPDGDRLEYSLKAPTNGFSSVQNPLPPNPIAGPYPLVRFTSGISVNNMIPGNPPLSIDATGIIRLTASRTGLFVFAVSVKEFRNGVQIGEVVREFQLMVLDCRTANPPVGRIADPANPTRFLTDRDTIKFKQEDTNRCTNLRITDLDPNTVIKLRTLNVRGTGSGITLSTTGGNIPNANSALNVQVCAPECPLPGGGIYSADIVIEDNSCAVPLLDTVRINVLIEPKKQNPPIITTSLAKYDSLKKEYTVEIEQGEPINFEAIARDLQNEQINLTVQGLIAGMNFPSNLSGSSTLRGSFTWTPPCNLLQPNEEERQFVLTFNSTKKPKCEQEIKSTTTVRIIVKKKKQNNPAILSANLVFDPVRQVYVDTVFIGQNTTFTVRGTDQDKNDSLALSAKGVGFDLAGVKANFPARGGIASVSQTFSWQPPCDIFENSNLDSKEFIFDLNLKEYNRCKILLADSIVKVAILVRRKENQKPIVTPEIQYDATKQAYVAEALVGDRISFFVRGDDPEKDSITMTYQLLNGNAQVLGMNYPTLSGRPILRNRFQWQIPCDALKDTINPQTYTLLFLVKDKDFCGQAKTDTAKVILTVKPRTILNRPPRISTTLPFDEKEKVYVDTVYIGNLLNFNILANDMDRDSVVIEGFPEGFRFSDFRMIFRDTSGIAPLIAPFRWQTTCDMLNLALGEFQKEFLITFKTRDFRLCQRTFRDSIRVKLVLVYNAANNRQPKITANLIQNPNTFVYFKEVIVGETISFNLLGDDADRDSILITGKGIGFNFKDVGIQFNDTKGIAPLTIPFNWQTACALLQGKFDSPKDFDMTFIINDLRPCNLNKYDSIKVKIRIFPRPNPNPPKLVADLNYDQVKQEYFASVAPRQSLNFRLTGTDPDRDIISITGNGVGYDFKDFNMQFTPVTGISPQTTTFSWDTDCDMLARRNEYNMLFIVKDRNSCGIEKADTIRVRVLLEDFSEDVNFQPPNVFTPNGDGKNDTYTIPNLPPDTCNDEFERIEIYNRWGVLVFSSTDRNFAWTGGDFPAGVYFYHLFYKKKTFKGTVTMLRGN